MIDLRSDTLTRPDAGMRAAMANADVGDDVFGEDPTVQKLEATAADLTGKEAALFVPSGTMANLLAFLTQTRPGDTVLLHQDAHPYRFEGGNLARFGGLLTTPLRGADGKLDAETVAEHLVRSDDPHLSNTTMVSIENTTNLGGGAFYTAEEVNAIGEHCKNNGLRLHCDGARLFNAAIAQGVPPAALVVACDSVSFCLSKGLGAPVGSVLASDQTTIQSARRTRKQLGGGMRQSGVLAAAGLYALENNVDALAQDHRRAAAFRSHLESLGIRFACPSPTNILFIRSDVPERDMETLATHGVRALPVGHQAIRVVFHRDITDADTAQAMEAFEKLRAS